MRRPEQLFHKITKKIIVGDIVHDILKSRFQRTLRLLTYLAPHYYTDKLLRGLRHFLICPPHTSQNH